MATRDEQNAIIELQRASDDRIRSEVAAWADATPEERLAEVAAMTRGSAVSPERLELPADTIAILERL